MHDGIFRSEERRGLGGGGITQFATEVVARLVGRDGTSCPELREPLVQRFMEAVMKGDPESFEALKPELKRARISYIALADCYIPEVARRLGVEWEEDRVSFADVTMGVARLQAILREIGTTWVANAADRDWTATMLLILPASEQHTLGAMVIAGWLRRQGISVCLRIGPTLAEIAELVSTHPFDGAMISIASEDRLEVCSKLIRTMKTGTANKIRVAVGGAVLERGEDVASATGADIVTNNLEEAVRMLGLTRQRSLVE